MRIQMAGLLGLVLLGSSAAPALAWSPIHVNINFGSPMTAVSAIAPLAVGGVLVAPRVVFYRDGRIELGAYTGVPAVAVPEDEPVHELVVYEPDGDVRTIIVRDADRPVFERFLLEHRERYVWRHWEPPAVVTRRFPGYGYYQPQPVEYRGGEEGDDGDRWGGGRWGGELHDEGRHRGWGDH